MTTIRVAHAGADYDVIVGPLAENLARMQQLAGDSLLPLVTDERVFGLYGNRLSRLTATEPIIVPEGEAAKDWRTVASIIDRLSALNVTRGTPILAMGGGSVGDVAGLAASLYKRGCPIIHLPTTLLAQVDSAIGGKTAIDAAGLKNLAGTFHHPSLVLVDPALLDTLDERQLRSGYAEMVKYGLISDPGFFAWCESNGEVVLSGDPVTRRAAIEYCVKAKAKIVAADPGDTGGMRALLNLGHTFGHAIEALANPQLLHGEAVAIGITLAFQFSARLGYCSADEAVRVQTHLQSVGLPITIAEATLEGTGLLEAMQSDKKARSSDLTLILAHGIGQAFVANHIDRDALAGFLEDL